MPNIDILSDIKEREKQISILQDEVIVLRKAAEIYGLKNGLVISSEIDNAINNAMPLSTKKPFGGSKFPMTVGDASVQVLKNEPTGRLHLDVILERITKLGVTPTRTSLDSGLRTDGKKRFKLLGNRIWTLKES